MQTYQLDVVVTRGTLVESRHRVHAAVWDASAGLIGSTRDPFLVTPWRSCAKPFQVMPFLETGGFDELVWGDDELALACASHGGEPEHVALAGQMLASIGMEEGDLVCGPHEPLSRRGARIVRDGGYAPTRLHNNCSGKHAAMLARTHVSGWSAHGYELPGHAIQVSALESVAKWTGVPAGEIELGVDGCGVVVFGLPLAHMARAYALLAARATRGDEIPSRIARAVRTRPLMFGGTDRFDSVLVEETSGRVIAKIGAEGVHTAALLEQGLGAVVKVEDGSPRAQFPALLRLLQLHGALPDPLPPRLQEFARTKVRNTRGEVVGDVHVIDA
ncbi:MAG: asparaginase [Gemmatimonadetes bacterium]|nr:asparaginase [Gemmatimonadota bacterium]MCC6773100.1 asparaginase [Gemmatimonadaceae bacterium]